MNPFPLTVLIVVTVVSNCGNMYRSRKQTTSTKCLNAYQGRELRNVTVNVNHISKLI